MADETTETTDAAEATEEKKGGRRKLILIGIAPVLVLAVVGYLFLGGGGGDSAEAAEPEAPVEGAVVAADPITVTMSGDPVRYVKVTFALVMAETADRSAVEGKLPLMYDAAISVVGRYDADDLRVPAGLDRLRSDLTESATEDVFPDGEVLRVVLTEVIVQ